MLKKKKHILMKDIHALLDLSHRFSLLSENSPSQKTRVSENSFAALRQCLLFIEKIKMHGDDFRAVE